MKGTSTITLIGPDMSYYRKKAIKIAKELGYDKKTVEKLSGAKSKTEITSILKRARHEWDVDPGRWFAER